MSLQGDRATAGGGLGGLPGEARELGETAVGPVVDERAEHTGQVSRRGHAVQRAGFDQRGERCRPRRHDFTAHIRSG